MTTNDQSTPLPVTVTDPEPAEESSASGHPAHGAAAAVVRFAENYSLLLLMVAVIVFFSTWEQTGDTFASQANFEVTVANQAVLSIVALALLVPLICGGFDLSVGATAGVSAIFVADTLSKGVPIMLAITFGLGIGLVVGLFNAFLVARLELDAVIATLGTSTLIAGVVLHKTGGFAIVSDIPQPVSDFGTGSVWFVPNALLILVVVAGIAWYILEHTPAGRQIYALGSNPKAAHLVGLRTRGVLGGTFIIAGGLAGLGGALMVARSGGADPFGGANLLLPAFAAAFLSATTVKPGKFNVGGLLIAVFFLAALNSGLNLAGAPPYVSDYVNGGALIAGVTLAAFLYRRRLRA